MEIKSIIHSLLIQRNFTTKRIEKLDNAIAALGGFGKTGRSKMSASARAKIAAAQRARWKKWHAARK